jgi:hypothetical protein
MTSVPDRAELVEALRRAMDELCAPELTLAQGEILRPRVHRILEALREVEAAAHRDRRVDEPYPGISARLMNEG